MSDVLIRNMKLPENCDDCEYEFACGYGQHIDGYKMLKGRPDRCPLIALPPHGRLIDADALAKQLGITDMDCYKCAWNLSGICRRGSDFVDACEAIEEAPTIIEAEEAHDDCTM